MTHEPADGKDMRSGGEITRRGGASPDGKRGLPAQSVGRALTDFFVARETPEEKDGELAFMNPRRTMRKGVFVSVVFVLGFLAWASFAELESAILAPGVLVVELHRKAVQHLEGGIVREIAVQEGDVVKAGQILLADGDHAGANLVERT